MKRLLVFFLWFILSSGSVLPFAPPGGVTVRTDTGTHMVQRAFNAEKIRAYSRQNEFSYQDGVAADESLWSKFWKWFWRMMDRLLLNKYSGGLLKYGAVAGFIALSVYVAVRIAGIDLKIIGRKSKGVEIPFAESEENIHEIDFKKEIEDTIAKGNYRLAVRLFYLQTLKRLNDCQVIKWQPEKTNQTYVSEISNTEQQIQFARLTSQFEFIWYGDFLIDGEKFSIVRASFEQFNPRQT
jgi:hypothetical protein